MLLQTLYSSCFNDMDNICLTLITMLPLKAGKGLADSLMCTSTFHV